MMMGAESWQDALDTLRSLEARLDVALAAGDVDSAMRVALDGAWEAAALVAEAAPEAAADTGRWHKVYVELTPLPLDAFEDGTLAENGTYVTLEYQGWPALAG